MDVSVVAPVGHEGDERSGQGREGARATHKERETTVREENATPPSGFPHASGELKRKGIYQYLSQISASKIVRLYLTPRGRVRGDKFSKTLSFSLSFEGFFWSLGENNFFPKNS